MLYCSKLKLCVYKTSPLGDYSWHEGCDPLTSLRFRIEDRPLKTMLATALISTVMAISVFSAAQAETISLNPSQSDGRIHNLTISDTGQLSIRIHSGLRSHGDRISARTLLVSASPDDGEVVYQHEYRLHRGQTYASMDISAVTNWNSLNWTASISD